MHGMTESRPYFVSEVLAATGNKNKIDELSTIAEPFSISVLSPKQFAEKHLLEAPPEVDETASTFAGNALLKAKAYAAWSGIPALADDSGLEVAALGGAPGVLSARYGGVGASDKDRWEKVLVELASLTKKNPEVSRDARFCCHLVLYYPSGAVLESVGELRGTILEEPRGSGGFGYDPIVYITELGKTLAEMEFAQTCRLGFRAKAARTLFEQLRALR